MNDKALISLPDNNSIECFRQVPLRSSRQLWCFAHAGAGAAEFANWPALAGPDVLICAVRLPGRERRMSETPATDMRNVVTSLAGDIHLLIRPDAIFYGQCLGALVAFEVASELGRIGSVLPDRVIVASQVAPQRYQTGEHISRYENNDFRVAVKALGGLPMEIENDEVAWNLIAPVLRADFRLGESYEPNTDPIPVPITALIGTDDQLTNPNEVRDWRTCSTAGFDLEIVPGNHFLNRTSSKEIMDAIEARTVCGRGSRGSVNQ